MGVERSPRQAGVSHSYGALMILMRTKQTLHLQLSDQVNVAPSSRSFAFPAEWGCLELVGLGLSVPLPRT